MKRVLLLFLAIAMLFSFTACGNSKAKKSEGSKTTIVSTEKEKNVEESSGIKTDTDKTTKSETKAEPEPTTGTRAEESDKGVTNSDSQNQSVQNNNNYNAQTHICPICGGSGQVQQVISYDMNGLPMYGFVACGGCGGAGVQYY